MAAHSPLLITGASGFVGSNLCALAATAGPVIGISNNHSVSIIDVPIVKCDLTDPSALSALLSDIKPRAVIHAAAAAQPNFCQEHPLESHKINVEATIILAQLCADRNIPFVFTSTDLVFDGTHAPYCEDDPVCPISLYGEQKVSAEERIVSIYPQALICRLPLMYGNAAGSATTANFYQTIKKALQQKQSITLYADEFRTPVSAHTAAQGVLLLLEKKATGIYHLGGRERITRYDFGVRYGIKKYPGMVEITGLIKQGVWDKNAQIAPRPKDVSLISEKAYGLGYDPKRVDEEISQLQ